MAANDTRKGLPEQINRNSKAGFSLTKKSSDDACSLLKPILYTRHLLQKVHWRVKGLPAVLGKNDSEGMMG
jgi:hypothetical protein